MKHQRDTMHDPLWGFLWTLSRYTLTPIVNTDLNPAYLARHPNARHHDMRI